MPNEKCAIVGIGQTHFKKRRDDVSIPGLLREAIDRALEDAELTIRDIDAVVIGKAPDAFEGIVMPEIFLADAARSHQQAPAPGPHGRLGGWVDLHRRGAPRDDRYPRHASWRSPGRSSRRATPSGAWPVAVRVGSARAGRSRRGCAPTSSESGAPDYIGWMVAVKDRRNAAKNPYAHLKMPDITLEKVKESPMLWDPIRFQESCPSSDGACAVVVTNEAGAQRSLEAGGLDPRPLGAE